MMRNREEIREAVIKANREPDRQKSAFKLFVIDIELALDIRDLLGR